MEVSPALTILGMALVTYLTRADELWLMARVDFSPGVARWLQHTPGAIFVSIVTPMIIESGPVELAAVSVTVVVGAATRIILLTMVMGVARALLTHVTFSPTREGPVERVQVRGDRNL